MKTIIINKSTNELSKMKNHKLPNNCRTFAFVKETKECKELAWVIPAHKSDFAKFDHVNNIKEIIDTLDEEVINYM